MYRSSAWENIPALAACACILFLLCITGRAFTQSSAQVKPGTIITGRIIDEETGSTLENVIAFLANTPIGTSSEKDGTFRITHVPVGTYELVLSCVGYERQSLAIRIEKPDSLYYQIKLNPRPIQSKGVEILGKRPESALKAGGLIFPKEGPSTYCFYGGAVSEPIGILFAENALYMYALEPAVIDSEKAVRVWLLYLNLSRNPYALDPGNILKLHMKSKERAYNNIDPLPPRSFDSLQVDSDKQSIRDKYGKSLDLAASLHRKYRKERMHSGIRYVISAESDGFFDQRANIVQLPEELSSMKMYEIYLKSINEGILGQHLVYPDNCVNGYVYFPFPGMNYKATGTDFPDAFEYQYTLVISTPTGTRAVEFTPGGL